jgi:transposase-like protein
MPTEAPIAGRDYPRDRREFETWFAEERACRAYLARLRWGTGFVCPTCGAGRAWHTARETARCVGCGRQCSVTAGTLFAGTRQPLRAWFEACWQLAEPAGLSARSLQAILGLGSYQTAWAWLHKLRRGMAEPDGPPLRGLVEVDDTFLWGVEAGPLTPRIGLAVEVASDDTGQLRLARLPYLDPPALGWFVTAVIAPEATVRTHARAAEDLRTILGPGHPLEVVPTQVGLTVVSEVETRLEAWCAGTHHRGIQQRQLGAYLDEFAFRCSHHADPLGLVFYHLLKRALAGDATPYRKLVGGDPRDWSTPAR